MTNKMPVTEEDVVNGIKELNKERSGSGCTIGAICIILAAVLLVASIGGSFGSDGFMSGIAVSLMVFGLYALATF